MITTPKLNLGLGRLRDHHDPRDRSFINHVGLLPTPDDVKLMVWRVLAGSKLFPPALIQAVAELPVMDQGQLGQCTGAAGSRWAQAAVKIQTGADPGALSSLFLYQQERLLPWNNCVNVDSGSQTRDIFYTLTNVGVCPEADDPNVPADFVVALTPELLLSAGRHRIKSYSRLASFTEMIACLAAGWPFCVGMDLYESFEDVGSDGRLRMPGLGEKIIGGHELLAYGHDDVNRTLTFRNSWGSLWGDHGDVHVPYDYLNDYSLSRWDAWTGHF